MSDRDWLADLEFTGIKLGLETIRRLTSALGHPERFAPAVHIAGTNGKGSTAAMVAEGLRAAGHRTGRYTSPHLVHLEERAAIDGLSVSAEALDRALARVRLAAADLRLPDGAPLEPTYFEVTTAAAFEVFRDAGVEVSVLEVGLGGRYDATNVVTPIVSAITTIDFDHQSYLGTTLEAIAGEKAGIVKPGVPVVVGALLAPALAIVEETASEVGAPFVRTTAACDVRARPIGGGRYEVLIRTAAAAYGPLPLGLRGAHQAANAAVAALVLEAVNASGLAVPAQAIEAGLRDAEWPGRLDLVDLGGRALLVDGAHNPAGARALAAYLEEVHPAGVPVVFGVMGDKDVDGMLAPLAGFARPLVITRAPGRRAADPDRVAAAARALPCPPEILVVSGIGPALDAAWDRATTIVVAGSLYLAGEVLALVGRAT